MDDQGRELAAALGRLGFFAGLGESGLRALAQKAKRQCFGGGDYLAKEGEEADRFYAVADGAVTIETRRPGGEIVALQTIHRGGIVGWSWILPPHRWLFDARAVEPTEVLMLDGHNVREALARDPRLGYEVMLRFAAVMAERLRATRLQLSEYSGRRPD